MSAADDSATINEKNTAYKKDATFWLIFVSLMTSAFVAALELTAVTNALPVIVYSLQGGEFSWVGAAYSLASTAFLPMTGGLAEVCYISDNCFFFSLSEMIFRFSGDVQLCSLLCFCSCSEVRSVEVRKPWDGWLQLEVRPSFLILVLLIRFVAVQGLGGGGIFSSTSIIVSDLVSLEERGVYNGLIGL